MLDYGCGSGILAIGAALHGGAPIDAVDIDPAAITTTAQNAADNGVTLRSGAPDMAAGRVPAGAGQHPRDAAEDAGARCCAATSRPAATSCWPASSTARPTS